LDELQAVDRTRGALPHWSQPFSTHFITFRLQDSLPEDVLDRWYCSREEWLNARGHSAKSEGWFERLSSEQRREYVILFGRSFEEEMDRGLGSCLLRKPENASIVAEAMQHFDGDRYALGDYVIMPNHVHALVVVGEEYALPDIMKLWKAYSARQINQREGLTGKLWQRETFDHIVRHAKQFERLRAYIAENPEKAHLKSGDFILRVATWLLE
jgi:REP element-mobilizing transposase RayT